LAGVSGVRAENKAAAVAAHGDSSAELKYGAAAQSVRAGSSNLPVPAHRASGGSKPGSAGAKRGAVLAQPQQEKAAAAPAAAGLTVWSLARDSEGFGDCPCLDPCIDHELGDEVWAHSELGAEDSIGQQQQQQQQRLQPVDACASGNWSMHKVPSRSRQQAGTDSGMLAFADCPASRQQQQQLSACSSSSSLPSIPSCADVLQVMQQGQRHKRQQGCQLPALRTAAAGSSLPLQQQQQGDAASSEDRLPKVQQAGAPQAAATDVAGGADAAAQEAVWKALPAAAKHAAIPSMAASLAAPSLLNLVQQAAKVSEHRCDGPTIDLSV
jgi:hypothetical protein